MSKGPTKKHQRKGSRAKKFDLASRIGTLDVGDFVLRIASRSQSLVAARVCDLVKRKDWGALVALKVDPRDYGSYREFAPDYLLCNLVKKYRDFGIPVDRELAAFEKWLAAEESCRTTNFFFRRLDEGEIPFPPRVIEMFDLARRKIKSILGSVDWEFIREHCRFGPGSDTSTDGDFTSSYNKYKSSGSATPWLLPIWSQLFSEDRREDYLHECKFVRGNRLAFVPKTALIDRAICTEPRWNIYLQLGIGELIVKKLLGVGVDLKDQNRNRWLAERAHVRGLATLDLSSASDTVSKLLVRELLPDDWADLIFRSRSPTAEYRGKVYELEKVSSMGNGYTFPLESLIFYALCWAACSFCGARHEIGVFGDDLIVPTEAAAPLIDLLSYSGFSTNVDKSFVSGRFFESCGHDYFDGVNVRPFFIKEKVSSVLQYCVLANQISDYARRLPDVANDLGLRELWLHVVQMIPKKVRLYGPVGLSGVIHAPFDMYGPVCKVPNRDRTGWEGVLLEAWVPVPKKYRGSDYRGHLFSKLADDVDSQNGFTTRHAIRWRRKLVIVPTISDFLWS